VATERIEQIEKFLGFKLQHLPLDGDEFNSAVFYKNRNSYNLNSNGELVELNLQDNGLSDLSFLKTLKALTHLTLAGNRITDVQALSHLTKLEFLDLGSNLIEDITPICTLKNLKSLRLDHNEISQFPRLECAQLLELWLYKNKIRDVGNLKWLKNLGSLNISHNELRDIKPIKELKLIEHLNLAKNYIADIHHLEIFKRLVSLSLGGNQITDISSLCSITIEDLDLSNNMIFDLTPLYFPLKQRKISSLNAFNNPLLYPHPKTIEFNEEVLLEWFEENLSTAKHLITQNRRTKEKKLDLGNCGLTDLSMIPELFECDHLEELILSNEYAVDDNGRWDKGTSNNNHLPNNIYNIPDSIKNLSKLKRLIIGGDWEKKNTRSWRIRSIVNIVKLKNLEFLNVSNNQIKQIPSLKNLRKITHIHLNNNKITKGQPIYLPNLKEFFLSNNKLSSVDFLEKQINLDSLDLHSNNITDLKPLLHLIGKIGITEDKWKHGTICIQKNPLINPSMDVVRLGKEAVIRIMTQVAGGEYCLNHDIKLILVGNSQVGKTTLANFLTEDPNFKNDTNFTIWMEELQFVFKDKFIRILDFGGHDFYHDTHHLFFTNNCIYFLMWEEETDKMSTRQISNAAEDLKDGILETQDFPLKYWLDSIKFYSEEKEASNFNFEIDKEKDDQSYSSSVVVIQNKVLGEQKIKFLNNKKLHDNYPFIREFLNIDIHSERNTSQLLDVFSRVLNSSQILGAKFPKYYEIVKNNLMQYDQKIILTVDEFRNYCNSLEGVEIDTDDAVILLKYLNNLGFVIYNSQLKNSVFIQKKELRILIQKTLRPLKKLGGRFFEKDVFANIGNREDSLKILNLLIQYKLIFKLPKPSKERQNHQEYVAPLYLPENPNNLVNILLDKNLVPHRRFFYTGFINKHSILSLFSEYGKDIVTEEINNSSYYWKNGLIIRSPKTEEILAILFNPGDNNGNAYIDILKVNRKEDTEFSTQVIEFIKKINIDYSGFEEAITLTGRFYVNLKNLINAAKEGEKFILGIDSDKKEKIISIHSFNDYLPAELRNPLKKAIISYSKRDLELVNEFKQTALGPLKTEGYISEWYCTDLIAGDEWNDEIQQRVKECEIAFIMISSNSMTTAYILNEEIKTLIDRYDNANEGKNPMIIPILLKPYHWTTSHKRYNLGRFSALPYTAKPVNDFKDREIGWYMVGESIRIAIEQKFSADRLTEIDWKEFWTKGEVNKTMKGYFERLMAGKLDNNY